MQLTEDQIRRIARQEGKKIVNGGSGMVIGGGSASGSSENAREAQHAKEADHALQADKAASADKAKEADHATKAAGLDDDAQTALDNKYLRKDQDDETTHKLTMGEAEVKGDAAVKGDLKIGKDGSYTITKDGIAKLAGVVAEYLHSEHFTPGTAMGFDGQGFGITKGTDGKYTLEIDNLIARMKMIVAELEVHEMSFIGGTVVLSPCGNRVDRVEKLDAEGSPITTDGTAVDRYRCYFLASDGDRQIKNEWAVGQLARCKTNNITAPGNYTNYQNSDYWRLVVGVSSEPVTIDGKAYHYFDLSNNTASRTTLTVTEGGESKTYTVNFPGVDPTLNSVPMAGDNVVGLGHAWDDSRKNAAMISADENIGWTLYKGINTYSHGEEFVVNKFSIKETVVTTDHFILRPYAAPTETQTVTVMRGEYSDTASYGHNDMVTYEGQTWIASGVSIGETIKGEKPSATSVYWHLAAAKGGDGSTYDIYLSASVLKGDSTGKLNGEDKVKVTAKVVKITNGTATDVTDTSEAYFGVDATRDNGDFVYPFNAHYTNYTFELFGEGVKTWNFYLRVGGTFLKTVTLPVVRDGKDGDGTAATVYTIEPCANFEATGKLTDASHVTVSISGDVRVYKTIGDQKTLCGTRDGVYAEYFRLSIGGTNYDGTGTFTYDGGNIKVSKTIPYEVGEDTNNVPGSATITLYDSISGGFVGNQLASLVVPISLNPGAIVDVNTELATIQNTTTSMQNAVDGMRGTIETIKQGQGQISLKVQDLQNGGIDTGKPHTSSQVDFTTLDSDNFYPVMIKFKNDDGVRHTVEIDRPLKAAYGSGKGYMTHGEGFSFRLIFSDIANAWGSYEDGQLRIESISQRWTTPADTPICPRIAQYNPSSFIVAWLRGGSKYDITVDCTDAYISGIWPYMMQVASNPSWVPDVVRLANDTWTTAHINAQAGNPYNLLQHDSGGFYADTDKEYLYRFGSLTAGHTYAFVGQPTDSKVWFMATWRITNVSGSKVYVDTSTYGITWQAQNPLGIRMNGVLGYIKTGASYAKSTWDSQSGFGTSESIDNTAVHANWSLSPILVIGTESGTGRDRAVLESVKSFSEGSSVSFSSGTYFDVSPLYGTDGRVNVKPDMLATGIDIKSHKIIATTDNFTVRNNSGVTTFSIDANGNIVGAGNAYFKGTITGSTINGTTINGSTINGSTINSTDGTSTTKIEGGQITTNKIIASGGSISFFTFDGAGLYSGNVEQDGKIYSGLGMSLNNLSVSGNSNRRISSVFLGNGAIDSRFTNSNNRTVYRVGSTTLGNTFYNYIKLERIGSGSFSFENNPEHAALGIETQGDFCLAALGGPSQFAGMCFASNSGGTYTGDRKHSFYLCSGGTFTMPSDPPDGMLFIVIQTGSRITFNGNGHQFRSGTNYNSTCNSNTVGQWTMFYFDGSYWNTVYINGRPW